MIHICNYYSFTIWTPFSLVKQERILGSYNTADDRVCWCLDPPVDALILLLMFSQWSLRRLSCTKDCFSCSSGFLWHVTLSLIYKKLVCQTLHPYAVGSIWYLFNFLGENVPLHSLFGGSVPCIIIIDSLLGLMIWYLGLTIWYKIVFHIDLSVRNTDV